MKNIRSQIVGCGSYLPETVVTNAELAKRMETSDDWIVTRTGIEQLPPERRSAYEFSQRNSVILERPL